MNNVKEKPIISLFRKIPELIGNWADRKTDSIVKSCVKEELFRRFEEDIQSRFGIRYNENDYLTFLDYVSSLFMVDMLDKSFKETSIKLPDSITVLDVGAGKWKYIRSLYQFLKNYEGKRNVSLTGIDSKGTEYEKFVEKLKGDIPARYVSGDILSFSNDSCFDMIFMAHMLTSKEHFGMWKLPYRSPGELFGKGFNLLKPGGLFIGIAYDHAGEAAIFNGFPKDRKIYEDCYWNDLGKSTNFLEGFLTFNNNDIIIWKK